MSAQRIAVFSMSYGKACLMLSGVKDGSVHVVECRTLDNNVRSLNEKLHSQLESYRKNGFVVIVDEVIPNFAKHGRSVRLDSETPSGAPLLVEAMKAYQNLSAFKAISFPKNAGGMFQISETLFDEVRGNDGKVQYRIDWQSLKPEHVCLLLTVYTATSPSLGDSQSFSAFLSAIDTQGKQQMPDGMERFAEIIRKTNQTMLSADIFEPKGGR